MARHSIATVARWLERIFEHEQGLSMDPKDPGNWTGGEVNVGELRGTKFGIAANTYGHLDIKNLTLDEAANIYIEDFLAPLHADKHEDGVAYALLDYAVHSGPHQAKRSFQKQLKVVADGVIGPKTLAAMARYTEAQLIMLLTAERMFFMADRHNWPAHGKGWIRRMAQNLLHAVEDVA